MKHVSDGILRRMLDEPLAAPARDRRHYSGCPVCKGSLAQMRQDAHAVASTFGQGIPRPDLNTARQSLDARKDSARMRTAGRSTLWMRTVHTPRWTWAIVGAALVALLVSFTPARSAADGWFTIFQARQFSTISLTRGELRTLPNLRHLGTLHVARGLRAHQFTSQSAAERVTGDHIRLPSSLPSGIATQRVFQLVPAQTSSFTFSAQKAQALAARLGKALPPMPTDVNGSTIRLITNTAVMTVYGGQSEIPSLVVGQTAVPRITSSGATLKTIEDYMLKLPGVSKQLAREIESIGNPTTTLPIPIPVSWAYAQRVHVQGQPALLVGDNTGVASVVIWEAHGMVYGVGGSLTQGQVLRIADSLR